MRRLMITSSGSDVQAWQEFLKTQGCDPGVVDGIFGQQTDRATRDFQARNGLQVDGVVAQQTIAKASERGFKPMEPALATPAEQTLAAPGQTIAAVATRLRQVPLTTPRPTADWPAKPADARPIFGLPNVQREFGTFAFRDKGGDEIEITDSWATKNIVEANVPQLSRERLANYGKPRFHRRAARQLEALWAAWDKAGLLRLVRSYDGGWYPRYKRLQAHIPANLSNHSWGTAFDINAHWNPITKQPALVGQEGSVRELVEIAYQHGFYWGGHFSPLDGMHFEVFDPWE